MTIRKMICLACSLPFIMLNALNLQQAQEMALKNNTDLQAEQYSLSSAKYDFNNSLFSFLPTASLKASYMSTDYLMGQPPNAYDSKKGYGLAVNWPVFLGGKVVLGSLMKRNAFDLAKQSLQSKTLEILVNTETKYYKVLETAELLKAAELDYKSGVEQEKKGKVRFDNGTLSSADYLKLQSETARKRVRLFQSQTAYALSMDDFKNYLSLSTLDELEPVSETAYQKWISLFQEIDQNKIDRLSKNLAKMAETDNPALRINALSVDMTKKSVLMSYSNFLPSVNLSYSSDFSKPETENGYSNTETFMVNASVPIFPVGDNVTNSLKTKATLRKTESQNLSLKNNINLAVKSAFLNLITSAQSTEQAKLALDYTQESYNQMDIRFQNGILSVNDMIDANVMLISAKNQYISAVYTMLKAKTSLMQLLNIEQESQLINIIKES